MSIVLGSFIEKKAKTYLLQQGLQFIEANYRSRFGEIDLIMRDKEFIIFVEVRARSSTDYGGAIASITHAKQQKIIKTALSYLSKKKLVDQCPVRFDVLIAEGSPFKIEWITNAFTTNF